MRSPASSETARDIEPGLRISIHGNQSRLAQAHADLDLARRFAVRSTAAAESAGTPELLWQAAPARSGAERPGPVRPGDIFPGKQALAQIQRERSHFVGRIDASIATSCATS